MVIRLILFLIVAYFGIKILLRLRRYFKRRFEQPAGNGHRGTIAVNEMVRDPVCGLYIASQDALSVYRNGASIFFCSEECRRQFLNDHN